MKKNVKRRQSKIIKDRLYEKKNVE